MVAQAVARFIALMLVVSLMICAVQGLNLRDKSLFRSYFNCPVCDEEARSRCADTSHCKEVVPKHGICSCCSTCAQLEGERCGPHTAPCGKGLKCALSPGSRLASALHLSSQMEGRCMPKIQLSDLNFEGRQIK